MSSDSCLACGAACGDAFFEIESVPVFCNVLWPSREEALNATRGNIELMFCSTCGHIWNAAFDPKLVEYAPNYENSLHFSQRFRDYIDELSDHLVREYDLRGKDVIDVGCGQGDFLAVLCGKGNNRGLGFDPSFRGVDGEDGTPPGIRFIRDHYSEKYVAEKADLITCRHVLEHFEKPAGFLRSLRKTINDRKDTVVFFEVPNALWTLRDMGIWDIIYEHVSYFSPLSLESLFRRCGFDVIRTREVYNGQFLAVEARPADIGGVVEPSIEAHRDLADKVAKFSDRYREKRERFVRIALEMEGEKRRGAVWGAGSKGVTFLNVVDRAGVNEFVVDINPRKQGMYVAGTGQKIVSPDFLMEARPEVVSIMNPEYKAEIEEMLRNMGLDPRLLVA